MSFSRESCFTEQLPSGSDSGVERPANSRIDLSEIAKANQLAGRVLLRDSVDNLRGVPVPPPHFPFSTTHDVLPPESVDGVWDRLEDLCATDCVLNSSADTYSCFSAVILSQVEILHIWELPNEAAEDETTLVKLTQSCEEETLSKQTGPLDRKPDSSAKVYLLDQAAPKHHLHRRPRQEKALTNSRPVVTCESAFRPRLEVDAFQWPMVVTDVAEKAEQELASLYGELATLRADGRHVLLFTGVSRGVGTTSIVLAMAKYAAMRGINAVVVDADWAEPELAPSLGLQPRNGWDRFLLDECPLADVVVKSLADRISLLPFCNNRDDALYKKSAGRVSASLDLLATAYDAVLIDAGPMSSQHLPEVAKLCELHTRGGVVLIRGAEGSNSTTNIPVECDCPAFLGIVENRMSA